jgi:hypothetical protein
MTFVYLTDGMVDRVHRALVEAHLVDEASIGALTSGIPPSFVGTQSGNGSANARALRLLRKLNETRALETGDKPLPRFLNNAVLISGGTEHTTIFRKALEIAEIEIALTNDGVIDIAPGQEETCTIEVYNSSTRERTVSLAVATDFPESECVFDDDTVSLKPHERRFVDVTVRASAGVPVAGTHPLRITATEPATSPEIQWRTGPRMVVVAPVPRATLEPLDTGEAVSDQVYQLSAKLVNTGNQRITGTLRGAPDHSGPDLVDPSRVEPLDGIDVPVGETRAVTVTVTFESRPVTEQTWLVPLRFDLDDGGPSLRLGKVPLTQRGLATPVGVWLQQPRPLRNLHLVIITIVALVAGFLLRGIGSPDGEESEATPTTTTSGQASNTPVADVDPLRYGVMECSPGQFVSLVATTDGPVDTGYVWHYLRGVARYRHLPPPEPGGPAFVETIQVSRWGSFCETTKWLHTRTSGDGPRRIIWLGPFSSTDVAAAVCATLDEKAEWNDCSPRPL